MSDDVVEHITVRQPRQIRLGRLAAQADGTLRPATLAHAELDLRADFVGVVVFQPGVAH